MSGTNGTAGWYVGTYGLGGDFQLGLVLAAWFGHELEDFRPAFVDPRLDAIGSVADEFFERLTCSQFDQRGVQAACGTRDPIGRQQDQGPAEA